MSCPNFLICSNNGNTFNGVCYTCDSSIYGYFDKKCTLMHSLHPSVYSHPSTFSNYKSRELDKDTQRTLYNKLEENRLTTGILNIQEIDTECPICYENKKIFVKHPTCNLHSICDTCFKNTFLDGIIVDNRNPPTEPAEYLIFMEFLSDNDIFLYEEYEEYPDCELPNENWPNHIKDIYAICAKYDRDCLEYDNKMDTEIERNCNNRQCPFCRKSELII